MAKPKGNGKRRSAGGKRRWAVHTVLLEMLLERWETEGWSVSYSLQPAPREPNLLATPDLISRVVYMYPHPSSVPPEKTGLHELLHIGLGLSGEKQHEAWTYYLEEWIWCRLTKKHKTRLHDIFVAPLQQPSS